VPHHVFFDWVAEDTEEGGDRVRRGELAEDVGDLVAAGGSERREARSESGGGRMGSRG
jgi:hypothetical protein